MTPEKIIKKKNRVCAYVIINAENGTESALSKYIQELPETIETYMIDGVYDIITKIENESVPELKNTINIKIRRLDEVRSILTMILN